MNSEPRTPNPEPSDSDVLVRVEHVSKKFCKSLKRSLWYGVKDIANELNPFSGKVESRKSKAEVGGAESRDGDCERIAGAGDQFSTFDFRLSDLPQLRRDEFWAVKDVSFELKRGECLGLIGHNGAGKSTLLKMLNGIIKPDTGRIEMRGRICAMIELGAGFNPVLTGRENIYNRGAVMGFTRGEIQSKYDQIVDFAEIGDFLEMPVQNYSSGMTVRLGFAVSALMDPDVLIIDEVLAVGDLGFVIKSLNHMTQILPRTSAIFVSHSMPMVSKICSEVLLLDHGVPILLTPDVPHGIEEYLCLFTDGAKVNQGNGAINVVRVGLKSRDGNAFTYDCSYVHENGTPLEVHVEYSVDKPEAFGPVGCMIKLVDQQMRDVIDCGRQPGLAPYEVRRVGRYSAYIKTPPLYLNNGKYTVTVAAAGGGDKDQMYCRTANCTSFFNRAHATGWSSCLMPAEWRFVDQDS